MIRKEPVVAIIIVLVVLLAGVGLIQIFDLIGVGNVWPSVVLIAIGCVSFFAYMAATDGFDLPKAKNDAKVAKFREDLKLIDVQKRLN